MSIGTILLIILVLILLGGVGGPYVHPGWQPGYGMGWYGNGGLILVIVLVIFLISYGRLG